jgi:hypothetical protein
MKKLAYILTSAVLLTSAVRLNAQDDSRERLHLGAKAGLNISTIYDTKGEDYNADPKAGFVGGGFIAIPIGKYLGIQPEVLFAQKGYSSSIVREGYNYSYTRTTGHIEVPVLFQIKPVSFLSLVVGPQFSYMTYREENFKTNNMTTTVQQELENNNIRKNTLGAVTGLDFYVLRHLLLAARVGWDLQDNNGDGTATFPRYRNIWMQGTIGLRF